MDEGAAICDRKYLIIRQIGRGSFGCIYLGFSTESRKHIAIKIESVNEPRLYLFHEYQIYQNLSGGDGIPKIYYYGNEHPFNTLIMDLLGPSLEDLFNYCSRRFSINTALMLVDQMLNRLEFVHSKHYIHRDIKPDNFLIGTGNDCHKLFLIDFGLAKKYCDPQTLRHMPFANEKKLIGTARYCSINTHLGIEQSRRDDMESVGYVIMYLIRGGLPWQNLTALSKKQRYEKINEIKSSTPVGILCKDFPSEFALYLNYCRALKFEEKPDYQYLRHLFRTCAHLLNYQYDYIYDWTILNEKRNQTHANSDFMLEQENQPEVNNGVKFPIFDD